MSNTQPVVSTITVSSERLSELEYLEANISTIIHNAVSDYVDRAKRKNEVRRAKRKETQIENDEQKQ